MRDTFSDCHPAVNFAYFALVLAFSMTLMHPVCLLISLTGMTWFVAIEYWYGGNKLMLSKQIFAYHKKYSKVYDSYKLFSDMVSAGGDVCAGGNRASDGAPGNGGPDAHDQQAKKRLMRRLVAVLTVIQDSQPGTAAAAEL